MSDPYKPCYPYGYTPDEDELPRQRRSGRAWYLMPIFLGVLGGILSYVVLRRRDPPRARSMLILGIILTAALVVLSIINEFVAPDEDEDAAVQVPPNRSAVISYMDIPDYANEEDVIGALELAVFAWERANPSLDFTISKGGEWDIIIMWAEYTEDNVLGSHHHMPAYLSMPEYSRIVVYLGHDDCSTGYQLHTKELVAYVIAHELGHYLGLDHTAKSDHLMHSPEYSEVSEEILPFDNMGYKMPNVPYQTPSC